MPIERSEIRCDLAANAVSHAQMEELDRWALAQFERLKRRVVKAYEAFEFHTVFHGLYQFCTVTLSALYLDILKIVMSALQTSFKLSTLQVYPHRGMLPKLVIINVA